MARPLPADETSVGIIDAFSGNFTRAQYLRARRSNELERRLGYGPGRLASGWWLLFALEKPRPQDFEFGGYTHFSGSRIGDPRLGDARPHVEQNLAALLGGTGGVEALKPKLIAQLQLMGHQRLAKVIPVARGADYPVGTGIYQCNIKSPIRCRVAAFVRPGGTYLGDYT